MVPAGTAPRAPPAHRKGTAAVGRQTSSRTKNIRRLSEFRDEKDAGDPLPIYVLRGADPYLLDQGRQAVRQRVIGDADPGLALVELEGPEAQLADVLDGLRTLPFLAPRRLVLIREADAFVTAHREALEKYLEAPSPTGSLCLEVTAWNETTRLAKRVAERGVVVQCEADQPEKIPLWLQREAQQRYGKKISFGAAQVLLEYLGTDFAALTHALEMLALYTGAAETIEETQVDALIARGHHERVWDLCDAVAEQRLARALELLDAFWAEGMQAPQIIGILRPTFRQLLRVRALGRRMSLDAAMAQASVLRPAFGRVRRALQDFSETNLADAYQALVDADLEAKTTPNDRLAMETLIHRLARSPAE